VCQMAQAEVLNYFTPAYEWFSDAKFPGLLAG
jgi:hypothetical protein